jgi:fatty acid desaturase
MPNKIGEDAAVQLSDYLTRAELAALSRRSDARGAWAFAVNWALVAGAFAAAIRWPHPLVLLAAVLVLGGRQLGLGILVHDCAHGALFRTSRWNERAGRWLAGAAVNVPFDGYRAHHLEHHRHAGTPRDPDLGFVRVYPVSSATLRRKLLRDVTGRTGARDLAGQVRRFRWRGDWPWAAFHAGLFAVLAASGGWWAYGLWWAAALFVYPAVMRLRQVGEHGVVPDRGDPDPRRNTSTTLAGPLERLLVAPNHVGFHLEHHLAAGVPPYQLRAMHALLRDRGFHRGHHCVSRGYVDVLRRATRVPA